MTRDVNKQTRQQVIARSKRRCFYCAAYLLLERRTMEHMLSRNKGGGNTFQNLTLACPPCNREAGSMSVHDKVLLREQKHAILGRKLRGKTARSILKFWVRAIKESIGGKDGK